MLRLCFHPRVSLHAHALERDIAVVPRTAALQNISRIALRTKLLVNGKIALAIFAGSSYVSPCWCDTLPTMIIAPAPDSGDVAGCYRRKSNPWSGRDGAPPSDCEKT